MPHFRHDCMNPHCCRYVGSFSRVTNLYTKPRMTDADVYICATSDGEHINVRIGDDGPNYHFTSLEAAKASAERGNQLYEYAIKTYDDYRKGVR